MSYEFTERQIDEIIKNWGQEIYLKILQDIEIYSKKWRLSDLIFYEYFSINAIFFCKSETYGDCVLKIGSNEQEELFYREYSMLREYNGRRFVKAYESDIDKEKQKKAMLIERCIPGNRLTEEKILEKRLAVFTELYNGLHIEPKNPGIYESYVKQVYDIEKEILSAYAQKAKNLIFDLIKTYDKKMLLHIDIHSDNILSSNGGYKIIDPKGIIGDPIFETGLYIFSECCENSIQPENIEIMFNYLEKRLDIPDIILRQCFYIETVRFLSYYVSKYGASEWDVERLKFADNVLNNIF